MRSLRIPPTWRRTTRRPTGSTSAPSGGSSVPEHTSSMFDVVAASSSARERAAKKGRTRLTGHLPCSSLRDPSRSDRHETHLSAAQRQPPSHPRVPRPHEHEGRSQDHREPSSEGPKTPLRGHLEEVVRDLPSADPTSAGLPSAGDETFPKARRILRRRDFLDLQRHGTSFRTRHLVVVVGASPASMGPGGRLGVVASRRVGDAVTRNRGKRRVREWFRRRPRDPGVDVIVILRAGAADETWTELCRQLEAGLRGACARASRRGTSREKARAPARNRGTDGASARGGPGRSGSLEQGGTPDRRG